MKKFEGRNKIQEELAEKRLEKIYHWYLDFGIKNGKYPTFQEIADEFNFTLERARQMMNKLEEKGYVIKVEKRSWRKVFVPDICANIPQDEKK